MKFKLGKPLSAVLILSMILGLVAVRTAFAVPTGTNGEVEIINPLTGDGVFNFSTDALPADRNFKMELWFTPNASNLPQNVKGWSVRMTYNTSLVEYVSDVLPSGHIFDGATNLQNPSTVVDPVAGTIFAMALCVVPASFNVSTPKIMVEITWHIIAEPGQLDNHYSAPLFQFVKTNQVGNSYMINVGATILDVTWYDATYDIWWKAPSVVPWLEVKDPVNNDHNVTAHAEGEVLDVDIYIHDCASGWEQVGIQFELWYDNTTLISYVGPGDDPLFTKGTWMDAFKADGVSPGIFYSVKADFEGQAPIPPGAPLGQNYFKVMILKMPNASAKWNAPFPDGSGKLLTLKITSLLQGLFPDRYWCNLMIKNVKFINRYGGVMGQGTHVDGFYEIEPKVLGRKIDIFTQYPYPYGGQGLNQHSDMFWPQKEVILYANVTYNDWPEQNKDVAWQVKDPQGNTWGIFYGRTNTTGVATTSFRLPWPCDNPEFYLGKWTVIGTVDVACVIKNDTLEFKYDYLVRFTKLTTDMEQYKHCNSINATIKFKSYAEQRYNITITMTVVDETGVPFGYIYGTVEIGGQNAPVWCDYAPYEIELSVHVIKFARAGTGTVHVGALNDFPFNGGTAMCPEISKTIQILAEWA